MKFNNLLPSQCHPYLGQGCILHQTCDIWLISVFIHLSFPLSPVHPLLSIKFNGSDNTCLLHALIWTNNITILNSLWLKNFIFMRQNGSYYSYSPRIKLIHFMVSLHSTFTPKRGSNLSFYKLYKYNNKFSLKRVFIKVFNCFWVVISKDH